LARKQGFSISEQELEEGINAVAAPILDPENNPVASISVAGPAYRLTHESMVEIGPIVQKLANEISREI
jgi:DNA-binding IclR family transcriptional regulator